MVSGTLYFFIRHTGSFMKNRDSVSTLVSLANGGELVRHVTRAVIGDECADSIDGTPLSRDTLLSLAQVKFQARLSSYVEK
jgi:hypothetical protein